MTITNRFADAPDLEAVIAQAVGAASMSLPAMQGLPS